MHQNSDEWLQLRRTKIGASDAPIIMGVSPWKTPFQLFVEKTMGETTPMNSSMKRGRDLEYKARLEFEKAIGIPVEPQVKFHPEFDWMMASLDGESLDGEIIVEIKCPNKKDHATAMDGRIPEKYFPQMQHQMCVCGLKQAYYFSFDGTKGCSVLVKRDDAYIKELIDEELKFYLCMINLTPPKEEE